MRLDRDISPFSVPPLPRFCLKHGDVFALDDTLAATAHRSVMLSPRARLLNAAKDLSVIVGVDQSSLVVIAAEYHRIPLPEAETACLFPDGHILVTAPILEKARYRTGHRVLLVDPGTGRVLDDVTLDIPDSYLSATQHPKMALALLTAGQGQDGSLVFAVAVTDGRLGIELLAENVIGASFNQAGTRLLTTPHPTFSPALRVLSWPDRAQLSCATAADLGLPGNGFGVYGCYLDDERVLAMTTAGKLVVLDDELGLLDEVGLTLAGRGPDVMIGLSPANFAVQTWRDRTPGVSVWRLPPSLS